MSKRRRQKKVRQNKRDILFNEYFTMYKNMFLNRFEYKNLPNGMRQEYIEESLFNTGKCLYFFDEMLGELVLPCGMEGRPNVYGEYDKFRVYGYNYNKTVTSDNAVLIRNNRTLSDTRNYLKVQCERLVDIDMTIDVNINAQKTPNIIVCDDETRMSAEIILNEVDTGAPSIIVDKGMSAIQFQVFNTIAPYVADKLQDQKRTIHNEILTELGINNSNIDKKERALVDEVNSNNEIINNNLRVLHDIRQENFNEVNRMFNKNIQVLIKGEEELEDVKDISNS